MVVYLGLDYLEQVLSVWRSVLSKCLLTVPYHLDQVAAYVHSGRPPDENFRFPWKKASAYHAFLMEESTAILVDSSKLVGYCTTGYSGLEIFNSDDPVPAYDITFNLCTVVPSSNSSSPDFTHDLDGQQINMFYEDFQKENLALYSSDLDELRLDILSEQDCVPDGSSMLPSLPSLLSRQKPCIVTDPLLDNGRQRNENDFFSLLAEADQIRDEKKCWVSEKICNEIQTCRLPDELRLDILSEQDCVPDGSSMLPSLRSLLSRQKPCIVTDTLLDNGSQRNENDFFSLLTEVDQIRAEKKCWASEKICNEIQTCRLPVPVFIPEPAMSISEPAVVARRPPLSALPPLVTKLAHPAPAVGCDPLGGFMALRSMAVTKPCDSDFGHNDVKELAMVTESAAINNVKSAAGKDSNYSATQQPKSCLQTNGKAKHHVVTVKLSDEFCRVLDLLEEAATSYISSLKQSADIPPSSTFQSLTPSLTNFLLRQKLKSSGGQSDDEDTTLKNLVVVSALSGTADIAAHCCLESAVSYLKAVQDKYNTILKNCLVDTQYKLVEMKVSLCQQQIGHPKVVALCREVDTWLRKKCAKSKDNEQKIAILVRRSLPSLMSCLVKALKMGCLLSPVIVDMPNAEGIINMLDAHNCIVIELRQIDETFPWSQFSLVVEFEYQEDSDWRSICERQKIRHMALQLVTVKNREEQRDTNWTGEFISKQIALVGSQNVTRNTELLQLLETRQNLMIYERDYSRTEQANGTYFSDIDVDENTCIVLQTLADMANDCTVQLAVTQIMALSVKYTHCWLILYSPTLLKSYQLSSGVVSNISKLEATFANFVNRTTEFEVKLVTSWSLPEVSCLVRSISEWCMAGNKDRSMDSWLSRRWLTDDISQKERFLLTVPCLSSFNAQLMLENMSTCMQGLLSASLQTLIKALPWVHRKILTNFQEHVNSLHGVALRLTRFKECDHSNMQNGQSIPSGVLTEGSEVHDAEYTAEQIEKNGQISHGDNENRCTTTLEHSLHGLVDISDTDETEEQMDHVFEVNLDKSRNNGESDLIDYKYIQSENQSIVYSSNHQQQASLHDHVIERKRSGYMFTSAKLCKEDESWTQFDNLVATEASTVPHKVEAHDYESKSDAVSSAPVEREEYLTAQAFQGRVIHTEEANHILTSGGIDKQVSSNTRQHLPNMEACDHDNVADIQRPMSSCKTYRIMEDSLSNAGVVNSVSSDGRSDTGHQIYQQGAHCQSIEYNHGLRPAESHLHSVDYSLINRRNGSYIDNPHVAMIHRDECDEPDINRMYKENSYTKSESQSQAYEYQLNAPIQHNLKPDINQVYDGFSFGLNTYGEIEKDKSSMLFRNQNLSQKITQGLHDLTDRGSTSDCFVSTAQFMDDTSKYGGVSQVVKHKDEDRISRFDSKNLTTDAYNVTDQHSLIANCSKMDEKDKIIDMLEEQSKLNVDALVDIRNSVLEIALDERLRPVGRKDNVTKPIVLGDNAADHQNFSRNEFEFHPTCNNNTIYTQTPSNTTMRDAMFLIGHSDTHQLSRSGDNNTNQSIPVDNDTGSAHVNPCATRVRKLPDFIEKSTRAKEPTPTKEPGNRSWEEDLRETTRKFLANSQQFSNFDHHLGRHHKVSIGLAKPLQRQTTRSNCGLAKPLQRQTTQSHSVKMSATQEDARLMKQSHWTTDDSPPMDLDFEPAPLTDVSNRAFATSETPKKRKLTYKAIPGGNGQTKLVFK